MKHILIADDDPDSLFQLELLLKKAGYMVTALDSHKQVEEWMVDHQPDLVVLDLMMEKADSGFVLSRNLKKRLPDLPIIILTAVTPETGLVFDLNSPDSQSWIKADRYLEKGLEHQLLLVHISQLLNR